MKKLHLKKFRVVIVGGLFTLALVGTPASAEHDHSFVAPAVAFIALSSIFYHNHHHHSYHHHYRPKQHHYRHQRRHSHSHGGYHKPKRKHYSH